MNKRQKTAVLLGGLLLLAGLVSCKSLEKAMVNAEVALDRAKRVQAPLYAEQLYSSALQEFNSAKKLSNHSKSSAETLAVSSCSNAVKAYYQALSEFNRLAEKKALAQKQSAKESGAEVLASEYFKNGEAALEKAQKETAKLMKTKEHLRTIEKKDAAE